MERALLSSRDAAVTRQPKEKIEKKGNNERTNEPPPPPPLYSSIEEWLGVKLVSVDVPPSTGEQQPRQKVDYNTKLFPQKITQTFIVPPRKVSVFSEHKLK